MTKQHPTYDLAQRHAKETKKYKAKYSGGSTHESVKNGALSLIQERKKNTRRLCALSFLAFPLFLILFYFVALLANSTGVDIPLKSVGGLALVTLAGLGKLWQKKYKISMEQMAGAISIGMTLALIATVTAWVLIEEYG